MALLPIALFVAGLWLAIPFAVLSAHPLLGRVMQRRGWLATPDEVQPCAFIKALTVVADPPAIISDVTQANFESGR
jgi:membrane glycosyltransferase